MNNHPPKQHPTANAVLPTLFFICCYLFYLLLPGPTYQAGFLALLVIAGYYFWKDVSLALFYLFLLVFFFEKPILYVPDFTVPVLYPYQPTQLFHFFAEIPLRFIIFIPFMLTVLGKQLFRPSPPKPNRQVNKALLPFLAAAFLLVTNQFFASYPAQFNWQFWHLLSIFLSMPIFYLFLSQQKTKMKRVTHLIIGFTLASLLLQSSVAALQLIKQDRLNLVIENITSDPRSQLTDEDARFRTTGTFAAPNYLAVNTGMLLIIAAAFLSTFTKTAPALTLAAVALAGGLFSVTSSLSRWAWIAVLFLVSPIFLKSSLMTLKSPVFKKYSLSQYFALGLLLTLLLMLPRFSSVTTFQPRLEIAASTLEIIIKRPLAGVGPGQNGISLMEHYQSQQKFLDSLKGPHNSLAYFALENGLPITILLIVGIFYILHQRQTASHTWLYQGLLYASLFFIVASLAYPLYLFDPSLWLFFLYLTLMLYLRSEVKAKKANSSN